MNILIHFKILKLEAGLARQYRLKYGRMQLNMLPLNNAKTLTLTPRYNLLKRKEKNMAISLTKPTVGGSEGTWGTTINTALDDVQNALNGTSGTVAPDLTTLTINGTNVHIYSIRFNKCYYWLCLRGWRWYGSNYCRRKRG